MAKMDSVSIAKRKAIGSNVKRFRELIDMSQEELGHSVGVTGGAVANWETGNNGIKSSILPLLCEVLGVDINTLLGWEKKVIPTCVTLAAHRTDGYDNDLPEEAQHELENYLAYLRVKYKKD